MILRWFLGNILKINTKREFTFIYKKPICEIQDVLVDNALVVGVNNHKDN